MSTRVGRKDHGRGDEICVQIGDARWRCTVSVSWTCGGKKIEELGLKRRLHGGECRCHASVNEGWNVTVVFTRNVCGLYEREREKR